MSETRFEQGTLTVTTYVGGTYEYSEESKTRMMVQIDNGRGSFVSLKMDEWIDLVCFIRRMDALGLGISHYHLTDDVL